MLLTKHEVCGVMVDATDYDGAVERIMDAAHRSQFFGVSALAVHGLMTGVLDSEHRYRLNALDLVVPDGQPVRWALNLLHDCGLADRVYGPSLTLKVCETAAEQALPVFLYGSRPEVLDCMVAELSRRIPRLVIAGMRPSAFRRVDVDEQRAIAEEIVASGARIVLVGLGCPRQEIWVFEHRDLLPMPALAVGAAFDFIGGLIPQAPTWMQDRGLEWLFRLFEEPRRLWRRYLYLNPAYLFLVAAQKLGFPLVSRNGAKLPTENLRFG